MALSDHSFSEEMMQALQLDSVDESVWLTSPDWWRLVCFLCERDEPKYNRKFRLLWCGCVRQGWGTLAPASQRAVILSEVLTDPINVSDDRIEATVDEAIDVERDDNPFTQMAYRSCTRFTSGLGFIASQTIAEYEKIIDPQLPLRILRDIVCNPFRQLHCREEWLWPNDAAASRLAHQIHHHCRFDLMPQLGEALERARCDNAEMIEHCKQPAAHWRGCWVVDALLSLETDPLSRYAWPS